MNLYENIKNNLKEAEMQSLFDIVTEEALNHYNYAHYSAREFMNDDAKELLKEIKKRKGKDLGNNKYAVGDFIYDLNNGLTVSENTGSTYTVAPMQEADNSGARILDSEFTGGGVISYVGEVGDFNFVGDLDGSIEFIPKRFNINTWEAYANIEDDAWNGKYGDDIQGTYDFEQKYAEFHPEYLPDIAKALEDYANNNVKDEFYKDRYLREVDRLLKGE